MRFSLYSRPGCTLCEEMLTELAALPAARGIPIDVIDVDLEPATRARYGLGAAYLRTGKAVAAERAYEQAQAGFERVLGPRHPDTLRNRAELALVYRQLGRYGDARALLRDTVDRLQRTLSPDDPLIAQLREILADIGDE